MNVASQKLCRELHELSGWDDTYWKYTEVDPDNWQLCTDSIKWLKSSDHKGAWVSAYDLGFLLRKLPGTKLEHDKERSRWSAYVPGPYMEWADTPEDAAAKLAIELIKQGILPAAPKQTKEK